ncbi:MAG: polymer-forming cytoskeletal protein [Micavibrio sp.]|jgi:cytoskeletal protein CcmA (bactofilin family)|nr:MAG: polymer-forming cytoskeletal protein [Micavibrio sp.]
MAVEKRTIRSDIPGSDSYEQNMARRDGQRLVVGGGISLSGEIGACEHLVVEGYVQASLKSARRMDVMPTGHMKGDVEIDEAEISGHFEGTLKVRGTLVIRSGACVVGTIEYGSLRVEPGASIIGSLSVMAAVAEEKIKETRAAEQQNNAAAAQKQKNVTALFEEGNGEKAVLVQV